MYDSPVNRGFIVLLLGEVKSNCDMEFFTKSLKVINEKMCRILSQRIRLYLSFMPQDISPYNADDPIALTWELISDRDECHAHLCEKPTGQQDESLLVTSLDLSRMANILHGLLDQGVAKFGPNVLLDVIIVVSGSGVNQLAEEEGEGALQLYGALRRVRWQNGHVTAMHFHELDRHLVISPAVSSSVVVLPGEKLDCIDEDLFWRGVFLPGINPFDKRKRKQQMRQLCLSINPDSVSVEKVNKDKSSLPRKKKVVEECVGESPLVILILKEIVKADFPLFWLEHKPLTLYSTEHSGHSFLSSLKTRLATESDGMGGKEAVALLSFLPCRLDQPLNTDTWYEYVVGKQTHWINSIKLEVMDTPNYCLPSQSFTNHTLNVWPFKRNIQVSEEVLEESREEESSAADRADISIPELSAEQLRVVCSSWHELRSLSAESALTSEELQCRIDKVLDNLPTPSRVTLRRSSEIPVNTPSSHENVTDSFHYKALCSIDKYSKLMKETKNCPMKTLGGLSPPPMTHNKDKIGVDSLLGSFDKEGHAIYDLEEVPIPNRPSRTDLRDRLSGNTAEAEQSDQSPVQYSWAKFQNHLVKSETRGLMNYESPPKSKLAKSLFVPKDSSNPKLLSLPEPVTFKNIKFCKEKSDDSLSDKITETKTSQTRVKSSGNKSKTEVKAKKKSGSEVTKDKELRTLLERSVVKALKGESLTREHPQFKAAYTQLFNVCKCFLSGLDADVAREKVEQLAISNAKQVVELQIRK